MRYPLPSSIKPTHEASVWAFTSNAWNRQTLPEDSWDVATLVYNEYYKAGNIPVLFIERGRIRQAHCVQTCALNNVSDDELDQDIELCSARINYYKELLRGITQQTAEIDAHIKALNDRKQRLVSSFEIAPQEIVDLQKQIWNTEIEQNRRKEEKKKIAAANRTTTTTKGKSRLEKVNEAMLKVPASLKASMTEAELREFVETII